jgi:hypothetical protein
MAIPVRIIFRDNEFSRTAHSPGRITSDDFLWGRLKEKPKFLFSTSASHKLQKYLKISHGRFLPHTFQFIIHNHPIIFDVP